MYVIQTIENILKGLGYFSEQPFEAMHHDTKVKSVLKYKLALYSFVFIYSGKKLKYLLITLNSELFHNILLFHSTLNTCKSRLIQKIMYNEIVVTFVAYFVFSISL